MKSDFWMLYVFGGVGVSFQLVIWLGNDLFMFIVWVCQEPSNTISFQPLVMILVLLSDQEVLTHYNKKWRKEEMVVEV